MGVHNLIVNMSDAEWDLQIDVQLRGAFLLSRAALPHMIAGAPQGMPQLMALMQKLPMSVLTDGSSASASEVLTFNFTDRIPVALCTISRSVPPA